MKLIHLETLVKNKIIYLYCLANIFMSPYVLQWGKIQDRDMSNQEEESHKRL